ncbi:Glutaminase kidney isoform, mitochondrial [Portunus trituberculatus]|uniref:glutaminase n=1 Tax=Portunus trituberculatus TaxID=210409 RepID=A0A5B7EF06_PORTR|nr:Glutaminase kidney isoform, mitochondrial [Portunus trituberculatus]
MMINPSKMPCIYKYIIQFVVDDETCRVIQDNIVLISRALRHQFVIPEWHEFTQYIEEFYWSAKTLTGGKVASYIPQLARFHPDQWGVSVCTVDGQRYDIGDTNVNFTMQSCSKPITYAIALNELGNETVHKYVGTEPSGRMFNAIVLDYNGECCKVLVEQQQLTTLHTVMVEPGPIMCSCFVRFSLQAECIHIEAYSYSSTKLQNSLPASIFPPFQEGGFKMLVFCYLVFLIGFSL